MIGEARSSENKHTPTDMSSVPSQEYDDSVTQSGKLVAKVKENPMVPLGIAGMFGMVGYGIYNYKNRGNMSTSVYLMHLRVRAQSMVVGAMTIGIAYNLLTQYVLKKDDNKQGGKK